VGSSKAKELYYFSERLSAEDAQRLGIVNAIFPAADFEREVMDRPAGWRKARRSLTAT
jgi:Dihydroxynaphthoic acid synthase